MTEELKNNYCWYENQSGALGNLINAFRKETHGSSECSHADERGEKSERRMCTPTQPKIIKAGLKEGDRHSDLTLVMQ